MNLKFKSFIVFLFISQMGWSVQAHAQNRIYKVFARFMSCFNCFKTSEVMPESEPASPTQVVLLVAEAPAPIAIEHNPLAGVGVEEEAQIAMQHLNEEPHHEAPAVVPPTPEELADLDRAFHPLTVGLRQQAFSQGASAMEEYFRRGGR